MRLILQLHKVVQMETYKTWKVSARREGVINTLEYPIGKTTLATTFQMSIGTGYNKRVIHSANFTAAHKGEFCG